MKILTAFFCRLALLLIAVFCLPSAYSQSAVTTDPAFYGPYNATFLPDGDGLRKPLLKDDSVLGADSPWSLYAWVNPSEISKTQTLIAGVGDPGDEFPRYLALDDGRLMLWMGNDNRLSSRSALMPDSWHFIAATFNGEEFVLYSEGEQVTQGKLDLGSSTPVLQLAPPSSPSTPFQHFGGTIARLTLLRKALRDDAKIIVHS